jgi:hypothetical protein
VGTDASAGSTKFNSFEFKKIQRITLKDMDASIRDFSMNPDACLTLPPYKLSYAFTPLSGKFFFLFRHKGNEPIDPLIEYHPECYSTMKLKEKDEGVKVCFVNDKNSNNSC